MLELSSKAKDNADKNAAQSSSSTSIPLNPSHGDSDFNPFGVSHSNNQIPMDHYPPTTTSMPFHSSPLSPMTSNSFFSQSSDASCYSMGGIIPPMNIKMCHPSNSYPHSFTHKYSNQLVSQAPAPVLSSDLDVLSLSLTLVHNGNDPNVPKYRWRCTMTSKNSQPLTQSLVHRVQSRSIRSNLQNPS